MTPEWIFVSGLSSAAVLSLMVIFYLHVPLKTILVDLCGTEERATFWTAFSQVAIFLTPLIFALHRPEASQEQPAIFTLAAQLERALAGLILSVIALGLVLAPFIPHPSAPPRA